jgi:hypothetical protein
MSAAATAAGFLCRTGQLIPGDQQTWTDIEVRLAIDTARVLAYEVGLAQGELRGRLALARELESQFGPGASEMTPEDLTQVIARQVH